MTDNSEDNVQVEQLIREEVHDILDGDPTPGPEVVSKLLKQGFSSEKIEEVLEIMEEDDEIKSLYNLVIPQ